MKKFLENIKDVKNLMNLSIYAGQLLIENGAEIYRAEDTVQRICNSANNVYQVDAYALPSAIFLSLEFDGEVITVFRKVRWLDTNLDKVDKINSFSRKFVNEDIDIKKSYEILRSIDEEKLYESKKIHIGAGIASAFFSVLFGGNLLDFFSAFIIGTSLSIFLEYISNLKLSFFINNFLGAFFASFFSIFFVKCHLGTNVDKIIIGVIMLLVPGLAITNSVRDIMSGEFITGVITLTRAIFIALAIALGVGFVLRILRGII